MRKLTLSVLACAALGFSAPTIAAPIISTSPGAVQPNSNVLFQSGATTGNPVTATLNNSPALVSFSSNETLNVDMSSGQARISGNDGDLTSLTIGLDSGFSFGAIEFNLNALTDGQAQFIFTGADATTTGFSYALSAAGQNFFSAVGDFTSVTINSTAQLSDVRQVRVTAMGSPITSPVPEPATWAMMLVGFGAAGYSLRRKKSSSIRMQAA